MRWLGLFAGCALLAAVVACGGGGGDGDDVSAQETDAVVLDTAEVGFLDSEADKEAGAEPLAETVTEAGAETATETVTETAAETVAETAAEPVTETVAETVAEAVEEAAVEQVEEVILLPDLTPEYLDDLCLRFCEAMIPCLPQEAQDTCTADCHVALEQDPTLAVYYSCVRNVGCENKLTCPQAADLPPACSDMCAAAAACPNVGFAASDAHNQTECLYDCAGRWFTSDDGPENPMEPVLQCITDQYGECDLLGGLECYGDTFCQMLCYGFQTCNAVGEGLYFDDLEACLAVCAPWEVGQVVATIGCTSNFETCDNVLKCTLPPPQPDPGAVEWCEALIDLCGADQDMWDFPADVPFCSWIFTGMALSSPGVDFAKGAQCVASFETCPGQEIFGCLMAGGGPGCDQVCELNAQCQMGGDPDCVNKYCGFEGGQAWSVFMCLQMQQGCDPNAVCHLPPQEPYADTDGFCTALIGKCGDQTAQNPALHDHETCTWIVSGLEMAIPTIDLAKAMECINAAPDCSDETLGACVMGGPGPR